MPIYEIPDDADVDLPEGAEERDDLLTQDEVDGVVQKRLNRERRQLLRSVGLEPSDFRDDDGNIDVSDLDEDTAFRQLAEAQGIELREDGKPKGSVSDEEIQELRRKASKVDDLQNKLSEAQSEIESTRETRLESEVLSNADGIQNGAQDDVLANAKRRMTYDDEYGWVAIDEEGNLRFEGGQAVGAETVVEEMREEKEYLFKDSSMSGGPDDEPTDEEASPSEMSDMDKEERAEKLNRTGPSY